MENGNIRAMIATIILIILSAILIKFILKAGMTWMAISFVVIVGIFIYVSIQEKDKEKDKKNDK